MTINKLERVMWRLRASKPNEDIFTNAELERAVIKEIGTDKRTYTANRTALIKLQWIKAYTRKKIKLTNIDLTDT